MPKKLDDALKAEYKKLWDTATIRPERAAAVRAASQKLLSLKANYEQVSAAIKVPWYVVGLIHSLESSFSLTKHLHNGDPLTARTRRVPAGHPRTGSPPFTWVQSAVDALSLKAFQAVNDWSIERICFKLEEYNGWGYRNNFPAVKSPYLWSFTNQYSKGKYVADHQFDPNAVSGQVGAMAILKQLVADGAVQVTGQADLPPPPPPPKPVPVPTGLYFADDLPFGLRAEPREDANRLLQVLPSMAVKRLKEAPDPAWWQVEVTAPDTTKHTGFARREWLKDKFVMSTFSEDRFAEACLDAARRYGTSAHFLIAVAYADAGMTNIAREGGAFGPLALTEEDWTAHNNPAETGYSDADRFDPLAQAAIGARLMVKLTEEARENLPDKRLPTSEELALSRVFGAKSLKVLLDEAKQNSGIREALEPTYTAAELERIFTLRPILLTPGLKIQRMREVVRQQLDAALEKAVALILKAEPELTLGPAEASADAEKVPWMKVAKAELAKDIKEIPGAGSNEEIEKYFKATPLGRQSDAVAWCAAFVSWCIKEAGVQRPVKFSALAVDWLKNGDKLAGPEFGAIAVTRPLVKGASGHVGFVVAWDGTKVTFLGGNQGDALNERDFQISDVRGWRMM